MPTLMISTCGTSLLTNYARGDGVLAETVRQSANTTSADATPQIERAITEALQQCRVKLSTSAVKDVRSASAELNGLLGFYNDQLAGANKDQHILLHTDTLQGERVAKALQGYLHGKKLTASAKLFSDLRTDTLENFQHGLTGVIKWCHETLPGYREKGYKVVFNLTGGFKSIQGWMQTLGMFYADEIIYIFESGKELLRIPRIPVALDKAVVEEIQNNLPFFRRLAIKLPCKTADIPGDISGAFLYKPGDKIELSAWGRLMWGPARATLYREKVHASPDIRIVYSQRFRDACSKLTAEDQRWNVNERIDDLALYLAGGRTNNPKRLDYKKLQGRGRGNSTHEIDAWPQSPAWRIFLHEDGDKVVLDDLAEGMH